MSSYITKSFNTVDDAITYYEKELEKLAEEQNKSVKQLRLDLRYRAVVAVSKTVVIKGTSTEDAIREIEALVKKEMSSE